MGLYYLCNKTNGADQLRDYSPADLHLCFHICKIRFSHDAAQIKFFMHLVNRNECPISRFSSPMVSV